MPDHESLLTYGDRRRTQALAAIGPAKQAQFGQYFTPVTAARLIASTATVPGKDRVRVLDPGAGSGILAIALIDSLLAAKTIKVIELTAVELDPDLVPFLEETLAECCRIASAQGTALNVKVIRGDYIELAEQLGDDFDIAIMNPPYAKISSTSKYRWILGNRGIHAPNMYAAFMASGALNLAPGGQLVTITPRSFANGSSFGKFREFFLDKMGFSRVHLFTSRSSLFVEGGVLQENIVVCAIRGVSRITVSFSDSFDHRDRPSFRNIPANEMVGKDDVNRFIRIPSGEEDRNAVTKMSRLSLTLSDVPLSVSTGRVVDFRETTVLTHTPSTSASPMVYSSNISEGLVEHPSPGGKPQWLEVQTPREAKLCFPSGNYVVVKRFTSQEERRRVVAAVWRQGPETSTPVAFDNKLNVLHNEGSGLDLLLAIGLERWLNSSLVDRFFRTFSGHTQINAMDLRSMAFPNAGKLRELGSIIMSPQSTQRHLDDLVSLVIFKDAAGPAKTPSTAPAPPRVGAPAQ